MSENKKAIFKTSNSKPKLNERNIQHSTNEIKLSNIANLYEYLNKKKNINKPQEKSTVIKKSVVNTNSSDNNSTNKTSNSSKFGKIKISSEQPQLEVKNELKQSIS